MAQFVITYPDALQSRIVQALSERGGWTAASGQTRAQFARAQVVDYVRGELRAYEAEVARLAADRAAETDGGQVT